MEISVISPAWLSWAGKKKSGKGQTLNLGIKVDQYLTGFLVGSLTTGGRS